MASHTDRPVYNEAERKERTQGHRKDWQFTLVAT